MATITHLPGNTCPSCGVENTGTAEPGDGSRPRGCTDTRDRAAARYTVGYTAGGGGRVRPGIIGDLLPWFPTGSRPHAFHALPHPAVPCPHNQQ